MKFKKNELKIFYEGEINEKMVIALGGFLKKFGYLSFRVAYSKNNVREIIFRKEKNV